MNERSDIPFNLPFLVFQESIITTIDSNPRYVVVFFKSMTDQKAPRIRVGLEGLSPHSRHLCCLSSRHAPLCGQVGVLST